MGAGGTSGGIGKYFIGLCLIFGALYLFLDSVRITSGFGWCARGFHGFHYASNIIVFVPFLIGVMALFYDASKRWAWWLTGGGLTFICIEIVSGLHWWFFMKATHFLLLIVLLGAGLALVLKSFRPH